MATDDPLPPKQRRFVEEYLVDLNATEAAKRAGYSAKTAYSIGHEILKKPEAAAEITRLMAERSQRTQVTADRVLKEIARLAFSDVRKLFRPDGALRPMSELDDDTAAALASVEVSEEFEGRGEERELSGFLKKVKVWDKNSALDKLCRHLNLYKDTVTVEGGDRPIRHEHDLSCLTEEELSTLEKLQAKLDAGRDPGRTRPA